MTRPESSVEERAKAAALTFAEKIPGDRAEAVEASFRKRYDEHLNDLWRREGQAYMDGYLAAARTEGIRRAIEEIEKLVPEVCDLCTFMDRPHVCHAVPLHAALSRLSEELKK